MRQNFSYLVLLAGLGLGLSSGCAVPQPRGQGLYQYVKEPTTGAGYHLYLPVDYVKNNGRHPHANMKKWPLVMTFHGMKPYDNALPQEREWEKEADFYGYIVCAPELHTSDSFMEYPLTKEHSYVLDDKRNVLAIMDHVYATTLADPKKVLSTSWSCGGYLAHYFPNRFPERFTCIATRLSNFSAPLLIEETVPRYRDRVGVAIFIGDGDFPKCKSESEEAVAWYTARGFRVRGRMIDNMGHSRIPQTAAAFFAESIGLEPLHPVEAAATIAQVQMTEYAPPPQMTARFSPPAGTALASAQPVGSSRNTPARSSPATGSPARGQAARQAAVPPTATAIRPTVGYANNSAGRRYPANASPSYDPMPRTVEPPPDAAPTQLASADHPRGGNWLEPTDKPSAATIRTPEPKATETKVTEPKRAATKDRPTRSEPVKPPQSVDTRIAAAETSRDKATPARETAVAGRGPSPVKSEPVATRTESAATPRTNRAFTPGDAGRQYGPVPSSGSPASASNSVIARLPNESPTKLASGSDVRTLTEVGGAVDRRPTDRVRRVNIKLGGPAIGTTPHYLRYEVDLPREVIAGSDFLWMDNGVWIGDEARGVKILETPGMHRISVLVVTADNIEYRGSATVHVLDRGPTAAAAN